ncbi:hypothetical protein H9P43_005788 [Blastocladiella emersonii ATCC 22665]|nr:hypothetical protein H9P43_005788 [Blastocladiella emersonii ATCC 22665]
MNDNVDMATTAAYSDLELDVDVASNVATVAAYRATPAGDDAGAGASYLGTSPDEGSSPASAALTSEAYRKRSAKKSTKLLRFFGTTPPVDVSLAEVVHEGCKAILHSKLPLCYFLHALLDDYAAENLFFVLEVERYEATPFPDGLAHLRAAHAVFETYLGRGSLLEVNIDDRVRRGIVAVLARLGRAWAALDAANPDRAAAAADALPPSAMTGGLRSLFDPAKAAVLRLLETAYLTKFVRSNMYQRMVAELDDANATVACTTASGAVAHMYTADAKQAAVMVLVEYMLREGLFDPALDGRGTASRETSPASPPPPPPRGASRRTAGGGGMVAGSTPTSPSAGGPFDLPLDFTPAGEAEGHLLGMADPEARRSLMRRMLQGFCITMLGIDVVQFAHETVGTPR